MANQAINDLHFLFLRPFIQNKTAGTGIYKEYVKLLTQEGKTNEVRLILKSADREVQNACAEYICETPVSNPAPGTYTTTQTLKLEGNCQKIYYTLDGSTPTRKSKVYTEPIILREGTTELKAFGVNDKNIESDVISRKYVIVLNAPKAPKVTPKSGDYNKKQRLRSLFRMDVRHIMHLILNRILTVLFMNSQSPCLWVTIG